MSPPPLLIPVVLGTAREGNYSAKVADFVVKTAMAYGWETELVKVADFGHLKTDERDKATGWKELMGRADGLVIVSPEYNHGYPGELKMFLDAIYDEYKHKPLGICGVSKTPMGGVRMIEQLRLVAIELSMVPTRTAVYFSNIQASVGFDEEAYKKRLWTLFDEVKFYAASLKAARQSL